MTYLSIVSPNRNMCVILGWCWTNFRLVSCMLQYPSMSLPLSRWGTLGILLVSREWYPTLLKLVLYISDLYLIISSISKLF